MTRSRLPGWKTVKKLKIFLKRWTCRKGSSENSRSRMMSLDLGSRWMRLARLSRKGERSLWNKASKMKKVGYRYSIKFCRTTKSTETKKLTRRSSLKNDYSIIMPQELVSFACKSLSLKIYQVFLKLLGINYIIFYLINSRNDAKTVLKKRFSP